MLFLLMVLLPVWHIARAGIVFHENAVESTITNVHSPTAYSHQSITHLLGESEPRIVTSSQHVTSTLIPSPQPSTKIEFPSDTGSSTQGEQNNAHEKLSFVSDFSLSSSSSEPYITYKDQSIAHSLEERKPRILPAPQHVTSTLTHSSQSSTKIKFPTTSGISTHGEQNNSHSKATDYSLSSAGSTSAQPYITYKDKIPVLNSPVHTPSHLTFSAHPIIYQKLPMVIPAPYISYNAFEAGHGN